MAALHGRDRVELHAREPPDRRLHLARRAGTGSRRVALGTDHDPAKGDAFNTACFSIPPIGQLGDAPRRFFYGPGIINTDLTLLKSLSLGKRQAVQLRLEIFNVFNTAQFYGAGAVDGNVSSSTFGQIVRAAPPRLVQLALKYSF